ncbi:farnesyl diphosphate synthase [Negativicoccus succinicivorans]|uniref:polyprenyl synthetase family protein n=1 Tax=Negativicoccus succinicivorans TaxID=620903 RepID=UPI00290058F9|nr:farnesyl diphosphate synthase [Negativicoccus succinicivorans]MDU2417436.1 polyprenyl synthetase family protein [Negativicoccus succinicivorans]
MIPFEHYLETRKEAVETALHTLLKPQDDAYKVLFEAMNYSLLGGGKRVRPILFLSTLDAFDIHLDPYLNIAAAIECVHTYSLIHDDLPCMDNDDYRRGRLTNHKKFTPAIATLAGDGLLTVAFEIIAKSENILPTIRLQLVQILAEAAGPDGMVGGQIIDMQAEGHDQTVSQLRFMDELKTGRLITAPLLMAGVIAEMDAEKQAKLIVLGRHLGLLFQIVDDILDKIGDEEKLGKRVGQDEKQSKSTYVQLLGLKGAQEGAQLEAQKAVEIVNELNLQNTYLAQFPDYLLRRTM